MWYRASDWKWISVPSWDLCTYLDPEHLQLIAIRSSALTVHTMKAEEKVFVRSLSNPRANCSFRSTEDLSSSRNREKEVRKWIGKHGAVTRRPDASYCSPVACYEKRSCIGLAGGRVQIKSRALDRMYWVYAVSKF